MELAAEALQCRMEERNDEAKRAARVRADYDECVEAVENLLQTADNKVQDRAVKPAVLENIIQVGGAE